jgi:predicted HicB family RNase H-like nuclease
LRKALELEAKSQDRSLNATIVRALREQTLERICAGAECNEGHGD